MPGHSNAVPGSSGASPINLEEAVWRLKVQDDQQGDDDANPNPNPYPDRPGAPDCLYYLRTGLCGYGSNCKYNHPNHIGQGDGNIDVLPERVGQPDCQYFLKTGTCKFGASCKYHHPRDKLDAQPMLNILGLPMRQDEKSCPYYMKNGSCKFGMACKFNHPQPATTLGAVFPVTGLSAYGSTGSSLVSPANLPLIGGFTGWSLSRSPYMSSPRMQGLPAYMPVILPPSQGPMPVQQGWNIYTGPLEDVSSTDVLGPNQTSNSKQHAQSSLNTSEHFPERPDQPECRYYIRTGSCKYGTSCKYNHPKERITSPTCTLGPLGLPLRPGQAACTFYSTNGSCKYGSACKFDHPIVGYYNYPLTALPFPDPSADISQQRHSQALLKSAEALPPNTRKPHNQYVKSDTSNEQPSFESNEHGTSSDQTSNIGPTDSPKDLSN